ncbi:MAG: diguanylate cyclase, partial [Gammaproteobacteria bacterium]|nr:diguanylate cyclase [Gammaproteobacteria bacterium]
ARIVSHDARVQALLDTPDDPALRETTGLFLSIFDGIAHATDAFVLDERGRLLAEAPATEQTDPDVARFASSAEFQRVLVEKGHTNFIARGRHGDEPRVFMATFAEGNDAWGVVFVAFDVAMISGQELIASHTDGVLLLLDRNGIIFSATEPSLRYRTFEPLTEDQAAHLVALHGYPVERIESLPIASRKRLDDAELIVLESRLPGLDARHVHLDEHATAAHPGDRDGSRDDGARPAAAPPDTDHGHRLVLSSAPIPETEWRTATLVPVPEKLPIFFQSLGFTLPVYGVIIFATLLFLQRSRYLKELYEHAIRDPLTRLYTRLYMQEAVSSMLEACQRGHLGGLAVIVFDLDHFKKINDTYGHDAGDAVLTAVSEVILEQTRPTDVPVRLGGEELAVFLPAPLHEGATVCAERIRKAIESLDIVTEHAVIEVTASAGIALTHGKDSLARLLKRADNAMYLAKQGGRNRVCLAEGLRDDTLP